MLFRSIVIGERDVTRVMANDRNIGFVFQSYALFPHLSIFENVAYGLRVQKKPAGEVARAVGDVLGLVGLSGYERQMPHQLSGGVQQRVALARAIVFRPRVLLFDEPLSNLDAKLRVQMRGEILRLQKTLGITSVYVTHDQEEAMAISDRIAVMALGEIAQLGTAEDLYHRPNSAFVAGFIGRATLIPGRVIESVGSRKSIEVLGHRHDIEDGRGEIGTGSPVRLVLRPEALRLAPRSGLGLPGVVAARSFLGEKTEYRIDIGGQAILVSSDAEAFKVGEEVDLRLPERGLHLLDGRAS